ncbi:putative EF-hand domain pair protein [Medicago truncatula]|uniref:Putative EF-hand domain pair protein n=1 Tax=Medicago truncatula TaxID=3880 RepID=A0A396JKL6_MEDTR|nr:putative EF-hand domain pair protein [Medicago truncatula]
MDDEVRKIFSKFDKNGDGRISVSELEQMFSTFGSKTTSDEVKSMMKHIDQNGDGYIYLKEFADFHGNDAAAGAGKEEEIRDAFDLYDLDKIGNNAAAGAGKEEEIRDAFDLYDLDKDGLISVNELHIVLNKLGEKCSLSDCEIMISNVDADGDGNVNFEEFKKMMAS